MKNTERAATRTPSPPMLRARHRETAPGSGSPPGRGCGGQRRASSPHGLSGAPSRPFFSLLVLFLLFSLGSGSAARAQSTETTTSEPAASLEEISDQELARRILELSARAEALMAEIARLRAELRRRAGDEGAADALEAASGERRSEGEGLPEAQGTTTEPPATAESPREPSAEAGRDGPVPAPVMPRRPPDPTARAARAPEAEPSPGAVASSEPAEDSVEEAARRAGARRRAAQTDCVYLQPLDWREDGVIDAGDRYWRYLYLWSDRDGDGRVAENETRSVFDAGVRSLDMRLDRFGLKGEGVGLMDVRGGRVVLDVDGDGFGTPDDGVLTVDADALGRGSGPDLLSPGGEELTGYQPLGSGLRLRLAGGEVVELGCGK